jgi:beta-phosphoglucomutase-like phosphatase (HAD superfamily)
VLGIPDRSRGCLFDLDGVLTQTARVHKDLAELLDER